MTTSLRTRIATATAAVASLVALTFAINSSASGARGGVAAPTTVVPPATSSATPGEDGSGSLDPSGGSSSGSGSSDDSFGDPSGSSDGSGDVVPVDPSQDQQPAQDQIGRASCRERV